MAIRIETDLLRKARAVYMYRAFAQTGKPSGYGNFWVEFKDDVFSFIYKGTTLAIYNLRTKEYAKVENPYDEAITTWKQRKEIKKGIINFEEACGNIISFEEAEVTEEDEEDPQLD